MRLWNEERTERAKAMWLDGRSASEIAGVLGEGFTRNSVLGKLHRMKLLTPRTSVPKGGFAAGSRPSTARKPRGIKIDRPESRQGARKTPNVGSKAQMAAMRPKASPLIFGDGFDAGVDREAERAALRADAWEPLAGVTPIAITELGSTQCRWPIGEVGEPSFGFCGCGTMEPYPYCRAHALRAYPGLRQVRVPEPASTHPARPRSGPLSATAFV